MTTETGKFDFSSLKQKDTATMILRDPRTGKDIPGVTFTVYSRDSEHYQKAKLKLDRARMKKMQGMRRPTVDPGELEQDAIVLIAASISGWTGVELGGADLPYNEQNALRLVSEVSVVREQIDRFQDDVANFLAI